MIRDSLPRPRGIVRCEAVDINGNIISAQNTNLVVDKGLQLIGDILINPIPALTLNTLYVGNNHLIFGQDTTNITTPSVEDTTLVNKFYSIPATSAVSNPAQSVANIIALPTTGNKVGDSYIVLANSSLYVWNGNTWTNLGAITIANARQFIIFQFNILPNQANNSDNTITNNLITELGLGTADGNYLFARTILIATKTPVIGLNITWVITL